MKLLVKGLVLALALASTANAQDVIAGHILFSVGGVERVLPGVKPQLLKKGAVVNVGDVITVAESGIAQIKMIDDGLIVLQPNSRLVIERYKLNEKNAQSNEFRLRLEAGQMRSVSGTGTRLNKQTFRLNTPIAAIGIRGTDFVTTVTDTATRVKLNSGAIVMSPFVGDCKVEALGACQGASARALTEVMKGVYLELGVNDSAPRLIKESRLDTHADITGVQIERIEQIGQAVGADSATLPPPLIHWGRFARYASEGSLSLVQVSQPGREVTFTNGVYGLYRDGSYNQLAATGSYGFNLRAGEAQVLKNGQLEAATLSNGTLQLDFGTRQFSTELSVQTKSYGIVSINAFGSIGNDGLIRGSQGNASVFGALSTDNQQAGYLFSKQLDQSASLEGVTHWQIRP